MQRAGNGCLQFISDQAGQHILQVLVHDDAPFSSHLWTSGLPMFVDALQNRKAEGNHPFERWSPARLIANRSQHLVDATLEQIVLISEMSVKGRATNVRAIENLLHRN